MSKPKPTVMEYRNYYLPSDFPVLLLTGEHWKISDIPSSRLHFHNCLEIGYCHTDSGTLKFGRQSLGFKAGDVTFIPRNIPHTTWSTAGTESRWSYLFFDSGELLRTLMRFSDPYISLTPFTRSSFRHILPKEEFPLVNVLTYEIIRALKEEKTNYQLFVKGLILSLMVELSRIQQEYDDALRSTSPAGSADLLSANPLTISPALDYMEDHYNIKISMDDLAQVCHMSNSHFRRTFRSIMNISPLDYLNSIRIMKACNLLCSTENSILSISEAAGFPSISNFNRHFIRLVGLSPREYRNQHLYAKKDDGSKGPQKQMILEFSGWMQPESDPE